MLISLLRTGFGRKRDVPARPRRRAASRTVVDLSGPLPEVEVRPAKKQRPMKRAEPMAYAESALVSAALTPTVYRQDATEMSKLPPELDPFESDFPWIGWTEPKHRAVVASELRTHTFERDLERVLRIFAN